MRELKLSADQLVESLLNLPEEVNLCLLDSSAVSHLNSHLLIAGILPVAQLEIRRDDAEKTLAELAEKLADPNLAAVLTISYDFGLKLNRIRSRHRHKSEPDIFLALFDVLIIHDYDEKRTYLLGNEKRFAEIEGLLRTEVIAVGPEPAQSSSLSTNFTRSQYLAAIEQVHEYIRRGDTYQTNLTQQIRAVLPTGLTPEMIFRSLRNTNPAPFASFIRRKHDVVISASPERFFKVENGIISTSPIKGTRPRGADAEEDLRLMRELLNSEKDRAENVMIVDLLRNDIGRICEYGTVTVEKLFDLEEHPTLFHLVSTVSGRLRSEVGFSEILRATFPCGSITGAPKIRTMQIIDELENEPRGLSMGAIGFAVSDWGFRIASKNREISGSPRSNLQSFDLSVAIRTMVVRGNEAVFNVGGGIVIDSIPEQEYDETLVKAKALLTAINAKIDNDSRRIE